jgi:hypothetical protein
LNPIFTALTGGCIIGGDGEDQQGSGATRGGGRYPFAFDPSNQDLLENVGVDPLGGGGEGHHHHPHHEIFNLNNPSFTSTIIIVT